MGYPKASPDEDRELERLWFMALGAMLCSEEFRKSEAASVLKSHERTRAQAPPKVRWLIDAIVSAEGGKVWELLRDIGVPNTEKRKAGGDALVDAIFDRCRKYALRGLVSEIEKSTIRVGNDDFDVDREVDKIVEGLKSLKR